MSIGRVPGATGIQPSIVDAKGDLIAATAADSVSRLAVGSANQVLTVDSTTATGLKWAAPDPLTTKGDLFTFSTTEDRLPVGANDTVLTADSSTATGLKWATPAAGGGMTLINTGGTALTGASVTVSSIPNTYKHLYVVVEDAYYTTTLSALYIRFNGDTGSNYTWSYVRNIATTLSGSYNTGTSINILSRLGSTNTDNKKGQVLIQLPRYTDTTPKSCHGQGYGHDDTNPASQVTSAVYTGSSAISSITFFGDYNFSGGTVYVYGVN